MIVKIIMMMLVVMIVKISTRVKFHSVNELGTVRVCIFVVVVLFSHVN